MVGGTLHILTRVLHTGSCRDQLDLGLELALSTQPLTVVVVGQTVRPADRLDTLGTLELALAGRHVVLVHPADRAQTAVQLLARNRGLCKQIESFNIEHFVISNL